MRVDNWALGFMVYKVDEVDNWAARVGEYSIAIPMNTKRNPFKNKNMQELHRHTLQEALQRLPEWEVPENLWAKLETDLQVETAVGAQARELPEHQAPDWVWAELDTKLNGSRPIPQKPLMVRLRPLWAVAASLCLFLAAFWLLQPAGNGEQAVIFVQHTQEQVDTVLLATVREPEDDAYQLLEKICRRPAPVCSNPEFIEMKAELDELTSAKTELRKAMGLYETDPALNEQLTTIERERSDLLRKMINMI